MPDKKALRAYNELMTPVRVAAYIERVVATAPPLSRAQIDQLRVLLEPMRQDLKSSVTKD